MSDPRKPTIKLKRELPGKTGRFRPDLIIELYPAWQWYEKWGPNSPLRRQCKFSGITPPLNSSGGELYYRLRVNGKWHGDHRYCFYDEIEAYEIMREKCTIPSPK